jgi:hypothetical protein
VKKALIHGAHDGMISGHLGEKHQERLTNSWRWFIWVISRYFVVRGGKWAAEVSCAAGQVKRALMHGAYDGLISGHHGLNKAYECLIQGVTWPETYSELK